MADYDLQLDVQARGTRIIHGVAARLRERLLGEWTSLATVYGFEPIELPSIEPAAVYSAKAGPEVLGQMFTFKDKGDRDLCLRPEGTATCQLLARGAWSDRKDIRVYYTARCYRYERPQAGRYREFTQFGVEWLNPSDPAKAASEVYSLAEQCLMMPEVEWNKSAKRGLAYYTGDGFEASIQSLGAQKQVLGGGSYAEGVGFAIGLDRVELAMMGKQH